MPPKAAKEGSKATVVDMTAIRQTAPSDGVTLCFMLPVAFALSYVAFSLSLSLSFAHSDTHTHTLQKMITNGGRISLCDWFQLNGTCLGHSQVEQV